MNNLVNIAQYKQKYGKICKDIDAYYEKIEQNPPRTDSEKKSGHRTTSKSKILRGQSFEELKQSHLDIPNQSQDYTKQMTSEKKELLDDPGPEFVSKKSDIGPPNVI